MNRYADFVLRKIAKKMSGVTARVLGLSYGDGLSTSTLYLSRPIDKRVAELIQSDLSGCYTVIDAGCGSGLYGSYLEEHGFKTYGFDIDPLLVNQAKENGGYALLIEADLLDPSTLHKMRADAVLAIELVEHFENHHVEMVLTTLSTMAHNRILITVPNPYWPHYYMDPTHRLVYNHGVFRGWLDRVEAFEFRSVSAGFHSHLMNRFPWLSVFLVIFKQFPALSPTWVFVGERRVCAQMEC